MNIPIEVPVYGTLIVIITMFGYMNFKAKSKLDKICSIVALILWSLFVGFTVYADLLNKSS